MSIVRANLKWFQFRQRILRHRSDQSIKVDHAREHLRRAAGGANRMTLANVLRVAAKRAGAMVVACGAIAACLAGPAHAQERATGSTRARLLALPEVGQWLEQKLTTAEREALRDEDLTVSGARCGCADQPEPHYPYAVVIFSSPKGDLIARFEGDEGAVRIKPLAHRTGALYCSVYESEGCFGEFAHPCVFTDARFGPALAPYFPDCKG